MAERLPVSVILPVHNRETTVRRAIRSVLSQTAGVPELILVDDGSSDGSLRAAREEAPEARILALGERRGAASARNAGVAAASHPLVAFQDSDDEWEPIRLKEGLDALGRTGAGVVYSDMLRVGSDGSERYVEAPPPPEGILHSDGTRYAVANIGIQTTIVRREALDKAGPFDAGLPALEDLELLLRLSLIVPFTRIAKPLVRYYETFPSLSRDTAGLADARRKILALHAEKISDRSFAARELREIALLEGRVR